MSNLYLVNEPPSPNGQEQESAKVGRRDVAALKLIIEAIPELYCNIVGEPCIRLPPMRDGPDGGVWPLRSERVRAWIAEFIWKETETVLFEREITRFLAVLEGKAWQDQRLNLEVKDAVDQEPVLEAILIWLGINRRYEGTSTKFLQELRKTARKYGVDTQSRAWPKGSPQLSRRIGELRRLLEKAGVKVEIGRRPGGERYVLLDGQKGGDDDGEPPSQAPSIDKSHHPKALRSTDGRDVGNHTDLFDRLKQPAERTESCAKSRILRDGERVRGLK